MKNHKKLLVLITFALIVSAFLGSYLKSVDKGLSTSVSNSKSHYAGSLHKNTPPGEEELSIVKMLKLDKKMQKSVENKLKEIDKIINELEDMIGIGTPDGNIYGIGTPDGNIVGIGTPDGN